MKQEVAELLATVARHQGVDNVRVMSDYSGRGMCGRRTWAVTWDDRECGVGVVMARAAFLSCEQTVLSDGMREFGPVMDSVEQSADALMNEFAQVRRDDMGLGVVLY